MKNKSTTTAYKKVTMIYFIIQHVDGGMKYLSQGYTEYRLVKNRWDKIARTYPNLKNDSEIVKLRVIK